MITSTFSDIKLIFDLTATSPTATLRDDTDYTSFGDPSDLNGLFTILSPLGSVLYQNTNPLLPDVEVGTDETVPFSLDLTTEGEVINGAYVITFDFTVDSTDYTYSTVVNYKACEISGCISFDSNCDTGTLEATDGTDYESTGASSYEVIRAWDLTPPNSDLGLTLTTSTTSSVTASPISTKTWSAKLTSDYTLTFSTGLIIINQSVFYSEFEVLCNTNSICDAYECIKSAYDKWDDLKKDSPSKAAEYYEDTLSPILTVKAMYDAAIACGDNTKASSVLLNLQDLVDCDCGCSDSTKPVLIGNVAEAADVHNLDGEYNGADVDCGATNLATVGDSMDDILGKVCGLFDSMGVFNMVSPSEDGDNTIIELNITQGEIESGESFIQVDRIGCDSDIVATITSADGIEYETVGASITLPSTDSFILIKYVMPVLANGVYNFTVEYVGCGLTRTQNGTLTVNP